MREDFVRWFSNFIQGKMLFDGITPESAVATLEAMRVDGDLTQEEEVAIIRNIFNNNERDIIKAIAGSVFLKQMMGISNEDLLKKD